MEIISRMVEVVLTLATNADAAHLAYFGTMPNAQEED